MSGRAFKKEFSYPMMGLGDALDVVINRIVMIGSKMNKEINNGH